MTSPVTLGRVPTYAEIRAGREVRRVRLDGFGLFAPLRAKSVAITFRRPGGKRGVPIGMADLYLGPGRLRQPLNGGAPAGGFCGYGPNVQIDGKRFPTAVNGRRGDVISGGRLSMRVCKGETTLAPGSHRLVVRSTPEFQPVQLSLRSQRSRPRVVEPSRDLTVISQTRTRQVLRVTKGEDALISVPRNFNDGWVAKVGTRELVAQQVDGWAQGWRLPHDVAGKVVVSFAPQRPYVVGLVAGLALMVLVQVMALVVLARSALEPSRAIPSSTRRYGRRRMTLGLVVTVALAWLLTGPVVAGGVIGGFALRRWPHTLLVFTTVALLAGSAVAAWTLRGAARYPTDAADLVTAAGLGMLVALALWASPPRRT